MSSFRQQTRNGGEVIPVVVNNNNFAKAAEGEPTLLSFDDVRTLFHEFGHGLHGLLSSVGYERLSGTNVLRDFVEEMKAGGFVRDALERHRIQGAEVAPSATPHRP